MEFELFVFLVIILIIFVPVVKKLDDISNIENYDISEAVLINNFISFTKFGNPCYFVVYQFSDNSIKEFHVSVEQYYKLIEDFEEKGE